MPLLCYTYVMLRLLLTIAAVLLLAGCVAESARPVPVAENVTPTMPRQSPFPSIVEFSASADNISPGDNVTLAWYVSDADVVVIEPGIGKVPSIGFKDVSPVKTTRYTLNAGGKRGTSTAWVDIRISTYEKPRPDLIITGVTHISGLLYYKVKNIGNANAGPSDTWLWDLSHMHRDTSWVESLKAGEEKTLPFSNYEWHGTEITICADGGSVLDEVSRNNNCYQPSFGFSTTYNLLQYASRATWRGSAGRAQFGPAGDSARGIVDRPVQLLAEDGNTYRNVLEITPPSASYSWIEGIFGDYIESWQAPGYMVPLEMPLNARFTGQVGLSADTPSRDAQAVFKMGIMDERGSLTWLAEKTATGEGKLDSLDVDLSTYAKQRCMLILRVEAGIDPAMKALWIEAKVATR